MRVFKVTMLGLILLNSKCLEREILVGQCFIFTRDRKTWLNREMDGVGSSWIMQLNKTIASIGLRMRSSRAFLNLNIECMFGNLLKMKKLRLFRM